MDCNICFNKITNQLTILNCNCKSVYHDDCINKWLAKKYNCPTCRKKFKYINNKDVNKIQRINNLLFLDSINMYHSNNIN